MSLEDQGVFQLLIEMIFTALQSLFPAILLATHQLFSVSRTELSDLLPHSILSLILRINLIQI